MRVCPSLICCLFLTALQNRDSLVDAQTNIYTRREGEDITVRCKLTFSGDRRLFCKETCEGGNILIDTYRSEDQRERYSIKYEYRFIGSSILDVTITKLRKSDSGLYRCELQEDWFPNSEDNFKLLVREASVTSAPTTQISSVQTTMTITTTIESTTKSLDSTSTSHQTTNQKPRSGILLYVGLTLVGLIFMFSVALLIFTRSRRSKQKKDPPSETQYANINLKNQEIRENASSPVRISTVYANVKYKNGQRSDSTDVYSLADCPQNKAEDHSIKYSVIQFPVSAPPSSAPCGHKDNDIYSSA
ncbi:uncharacterized protein LOC112159780 [Oryzias melastigma]|uniref:uncharacterized protein LOC112159780 n=1 Tax=Oryzias melastigma TaxID=30732 RepID=UPI000CF7DFB9|nr:uncharacterized protein LOC112159780 [Oryzias melastigma]XP_036068797.1 uncharacterized protein LOC112159780 [Oryzias melastigma]